MSDLIKAIENMKAYVDAVITGAERAIHMMPVVTRQKIAAKAKNKLNSTYDNYMNALKTEIHENVLIIELEEDNWLANATESGVSPYDMKEGLLNGKSSKMSKKGYRYASVPIAKNKNTKPEAMGTPKQQEYQRLIQQVMNKPKYGKKNFKQGLDGSLMESQEIMNNKVSGLYRVRKHKSAKDYYAGKSQGKFGLVMFRTVSEKGSLTGADWKHPGIKPAGIFKLIEKDLPLIFETLLDTNIEAEVRGLKF